MSLCHNFEGCLPALLDERLWVETRCLDISAGTVTSKCSVNTWRDFVRFEEPVWQFGKGAWHNDYRVISLRIPRFKSVSNFIVLWYAVLPPD